MQRRKGIRFEQEVAIALRAIFPNAKRHLEVQKQEAKGFDLDGCGPYKIQCKSKINYQNPSCLETIQRGPDEVRLLITKANEKKPVVCMYLEDFIPLLAKAQGADRDK